MLRTSALARISCSHADFPGKERCDGLVFLAVGILHGLLAKVALLQAGLRSLRVDAGRRIRAPTDEEGRGVRVRACRAARDDLVACLVLLAADGIVASRQAVEGVERVVRVAVDDIGGYGVGEAADEGCILAATEGLAVACQCQLLDIDA